jgi:heme exporter protein A
VSTDNLNAKNLSLIRGGRELFTNLNFIVKPGDLLLIQGENGSGKTSLLKVIAGLIEPDNGSLFWSNKNIISQRQSFHKNIAWLSHNTGFKGDLTILENIKFESSLRKMSIEKLEDSLKHFQLTEFSKIPFRFLSVGQQKRAAIVRMCLINVKLWLMDEPLSNLDATGQSLVIDLINNHTKKSGLCVLASHHAISHDLISKRINL